MWHRFIMGHEFMAAKVQKIHELHAGWIKSQDLVLAFQAKGLGVEFFIITL